MPRCLPDNTAVSMWILDATKVTLSKVTVPRGEHLAQHTLTMSTTADLARLRLRPTSMWLRLARWQYLLPALWAGVDVLNGLQKLDSFVRILTVQAV